MIANGIETVATAASVVEIVVTADDVTMTDPDVTCLTTDPAVEVTGTAMTAVTATVATAETTEVVIEEIRAAAAVRRRPVGAKSLLLI
jgi:hypothetical protein